jgi:hypothetical protein
MGVSILSYAGQVTLGVATDLGLVPDPDAIVDAFHAEFDDFMALVSQVEEDDRPQTADGGQGTGDERQGTADEGRPTADTRHPSPDTTLCQATTKAGQPCKNKALPGSAFCRVHQPV